MLKIFAVWNLPSWATLGLSAACIALASLSCPAPARADCTTDWTDGYQFPGADGVVYCSAVYDSGDGTGPHLYVGGNFTQIGGIYANSIAMWTGSTWAPIVGAGKNKSFPGVYLGYSTSTTNHSGAAGIVSAMAVYNGFLYVGGQFHQIGPGALGSGNVGRFNNIARWNGSVWSAVGIGSTATTGGLSGVPGTPVEQTPGPQCDAMTVYDDGSGSGPLLYVAGFFAKASNTSANSIAKWDGSSFLTLAGSGSKGVDDYQITSLATYSGNLYVGGFFDRADNLPNTRGLAQYNASGWSSIGSTDNGVVESLATYNDGTGSKLYVGGLFNTVGISTGSPAGTPAAAIASWDSVSQTWSQVGSGLTEVTSLAVLGTKLYAASQRAGFNQYSGSNWAPVPDAQPTAVFSPSVFALTSFSTPAAGFSQSQLIASGAFEHLGSVPALDAAFYNGTSVTSVPTETTLNSTAVDPTLSSLIISGLSRLVVGDEDGTGVAHSPALYAFGQAPRSAGDVGTRFVARLDGTAWNLLGTYPFGGTASSPAAAVFFDDGVHGSRLHIVTTAGGLARWNGASWDILQADSLNSPLGEGVYSAAVFNDGAGGGDHIYIAGAFAGFAGVSAQNIVKWNLSEGWTVVSSDVFDATIFTLAPYNGRLYAGGFFHTIGSTNASNIASWNGSAWSNLSTGTNGTVNALVMFNNKLYVGGDFTSVGGGPAGSGLAAWDSGTSTWTGFTGNARIQSMGVGSDGTSTPGLFVSGGWTSIAGVPATGIAKFDGTSTFTPLGTGLLSQTGTGIASSIASVNNAVYMTGNFDTAASVSNPIRLSAGFAKWSTSGCCPADFNGDGARDVADLFGYINAWLAKTINADFNHDNVVDVADLFGFINAWLAGC